VARAADFAVIYLLILANVAAFAFEIANGADFMAPTGQKLIELGANYAPLTMHGQAWRLVSSTFLHYGVIHIALNMMCLWQGRIVERLFGHRAFAGIYAFAAVTGSFASLLRNAMVPPGMQAASAGASGAVFGVYGAFGAYLVLRRSTIAEDTWQRTVRQVTSFLGINLLYGFAAPRIDVAAHFGGLIGGFLAAALVLVGRRSDEQRALRAAILAIATVALVAGANLAFAPTDVVP
jgi:rhomboid protease GluP